MTPCRLSACSMLSSVEATLVGGLLPLFSQYRTDRGRHPAARARSACVSPASIRAARIWRPETMLLITRLYIRFWKRRHRSSALSKAGPDIPYVATSERPMISPQTSYRLDNRNNAGGAKESDEQKITLPRGKTTAKRSQRRER